MPVPTDPYNFANGAVADADQVDARFAPLYAALAGGLDRTNMVPGGLAPTVTALPTGPVDQQECMFLADAANGILWHLRYRTASTSPYKWEFVGGAALSAIIETAEAFTSPSAGAFGNPTTLGPDITVPLAGDYDYEMEAKVLNNAAAICSVSLGLNVGGVAPVTADVAVVTLNAVNHWGEPRRSKRRVALAAGTLMRVQYANSPAQSVTYQQRRLAVRPVRVG